MVTFPSTGTQPYGPAVKAYIDALGPAINVLNPTYGADNTGVASATTPIQNALNAAAATGTTSGAVFVPPGTYKIDNLTIPDKVSLIGAGPKASKLLATATGAALSVGVDSVLEGFYLTGTTIAGGIGIKSRVNSLHTTLRNLSVTGHVTGVQLDNSYIMSIRDCNIQSCTTGLNLTGTTGCNIITVHGGETQGCTNGVIIDGVNNYGLKFVQHTSEGNSNKGYAVNGATYGLSIRDGYVEANTNGHIVFAGTGHFGPIVDACFFTGAATFGVSVGDGVSVKDISVNDNTFNLTTAGAKTIDLGTAVTFAEVKRNHYVSGSQGAFAPATMFRGTRLTQEDSGKLVLGASASAASSGGASLNIPHGTAPASPNNGDIWTTTAGLFVRINGVTVGPLT